MKILHLYKDYYPVLGGIENHIRVLAEAQAAAGQEVTVLVCAPGVRTRRETLNGVQVIKAGRWATVASMPVSLAQPWILSGMRPDVAHIHSPYPLGEAANWLLGRARGTVITYHSDIVRQKHFLPIYGPILNRVLSAADRIIATSPPYIDTSPWLRRTRDKCTVVPLGADVTRFAPVERPQTGPLELLSVGRLRYYKGLDTLLHAMYLVGLMESAKPDVHLSIVGDGPMRREWELRAHQFGLEDRVQFMGEVDDADLPGWYQRSDVFVLPANARSEAFGTVLIEAMASGLPCITTEVGTGTSWVVQDGVTGLVVPAQDPPALATAIQAMQDADLRRRMGQAGYTRAQNLFTQQRMIDQVMAVYEDVLRSS